MTQTFPIANPIWCAGCGHFGVLASLDSSIDRLGISRHDVMVLAGIGCSGTIQNYIEGYGYHALHGRVLPTAIGAKLANPGLTVIAAGGDGDGLAIGAGHLVHAFRANPSIVYVLMNNGTYGLTKGQVSPTSATGFKGSTAQRPVDPIMLGLSLPGSTFLARGYTGRPSQLDGLVDQAIAHANAGRGFAFVEIISPCVTYNDLYPEWPSRLHDLDADAGYDATSRGGALARGVELDERGSVGLGVVFRGEATSLESALASHPPATLDLDPVRHRAEFQRLIDGFRG